jgi:hypothetical protein
MFADVPITEATAALAALAVLVGLGLFLLLVWSDRTGQPPSGD